MQNLVIFGVSGFALQMKYYFEQTGNYRVIAFAVDAEYRVEREFCRLPVITTDELVSHKESNEIVCFLALGYRDMLARKNKFDELKKKGCQFVSYISPHATIQISNEDIGENSVILANSVIEPFAYIENNVFVWSNATVCHDVKIMSHCFVAAGTVIGGNCSLEECSFIGFNSTISSNCKIARSTLIGANSFINSDTEEFHFYVGSPAIKKNKLSTEGIKISG